MCGPLSPPPPSLVGGRDEREARMGMENVVRKGEGGREKRRERGEEGEEEGER